MSKERFDRSKPHVHISSTVGDEEFASYETLANIAKCQRKEIQSLKAELEESNRRRDIAEECVDFYAQKENWQDFSKSGDYTTIDDSDCLLEVNIYGGKRARETQKLRDKGE